MGMAWDIDAIYIWLRVNNQKVERVLKHMAKILWHVGLMFQCDLPLTYIVIFCVFIV